MISWDKNETWCGYVDIWMEKWEIVWLNDDNDIDMIIGILLFLSFNDAKEMQWIMIYKMNKIKEMIFFYLFKKWIWNDQTKNAIEWRDVIKSDQMGTLHKSF